MGAPLVGSHVQASVLTGGSLHFKGLRPRLQSKRLQMICECRLRWAGRVATRGCMLSFNMGGFSRAHCSVDARKLGRLRLPALPCSPAEGR